MKNNFKVKQFLKHLKRTRGIVISDIKFKGFGIWHLTTNKGNVFEFDERTWKYKIIPKEVNK